MSVFFCSVSGTSNFNYDINIILIEESMNKIVNKSKCRVLFNMLGGKQVWDNPGRNSTNTNP
jgi:hypothetical protein